MTIVVTSANLPRQRLAHQARRDQIIAKATEIFAEHGFGANTRMLAKELGTTQPLLYRYFAGKDELIQAVLEDVQERHSRVDWVATLTDRAVPLRQRLIDFSVEYSKLVYDRVWIRTYMFAGLIGAEHNRRYIANTTEPILRAIALEIRHDLRADSAALVPPTGMELELVWHFHGGLYYQAIRQHIYGLHVDDQMFHGIVSASTDALLHAMKGLSVV